MDIQNHFYGHSAVLAGHAGLRAVRHIAGLYQHGWTPVTPLRTHFADLAAAAPRGGLFTWTHDSRGWTEEKSRTETGFESTPIGAAALYLARGVEALGTRPSKRLGTVVFPFHGTRLVSVDGDQAALAREVCEREGSAVVCMHVDDLQRPEIVAAWRDAGHTLTTAGERRDPDFLARIMWLVMSAKKVVSNRLATALVYAAAVGTPVQLYGPHFQISGIDETSSEEYLRDLWPEFYLDRPDPEVLRQIALRELGENYLRSPAELRQLLGWDRPTAKPFLDYWLGAPIMKAKTVLGLRAREVGTVVNEVAVSPVQFLKNPLEHLPGRLPRTASTQLVAPKFDTRV